MSCVLCNCERCIHHDGDGCTLEHVDLDHGFCIDLETVISRTKEDQLSLLIARATLESQPILEVDGNVRNLDTARGVARARIISKKGILEYVAENNKLRELVRDMWCNGFNDDTPFDVEERIFIQMEKLGISTELR